MFGRKCFSDGKELSWSNPEFLPFIFIQAKSVAESYKVSPMVFRPNVLLYTKDKGKVWTKYLRFLLECLLFLRYNWWLTLTQFHRWYFVQTLLLTIYLGKTFGQNTNDGFWNASLTKNNDWRAPRLVGSHCAHEFTRAAGANMRIARMF